VINNRFLVVQQIGQGASSKVYKAKDLRQNRFVAIKYLIFQHDEYEMSLVQKEVANLQKTKHRNIMRFYQVLRYRDKLMLICELIEGQSLQALIQTQFGDIQEQLEKRLNVTEIHAEMDQYQSDKNICFRYHSFVKQLL